MTTYVNASCQCELNAFRVAFDTASLPITAEICHCSICRHTSGQMALSYAPIEGVPLTRANGLSVHSSRSPSRAGLRIHSADESSPTPPHNDNRHHSATANGLLAPLPVLAVDEVETPYELGDMMKYTSSPGITRYFCKSCSANLFWVHHGDTGDKWEVTVGVLEKIDGLIKKGCHICVGDTLDGGLADR
ncbi:hypothetical protein BJ912DRAFT_66390 [Pholiota molesta]|nr:hypothetical protein BJ912DRAFT_66390 [Pholiota molesta]